MTSAVTLEEALTGMHARILRCPLGGNPVDCPLHEIRKLPTEERLAWLHAKSAAEVMNLYMQHVDCFEFKAAQRAPETD